MGAVYKARQRGLDRIVALKILPPEVGRDPTFAERFGREARALGRLNHPHIVTVHDQGRTADGQYYFFIMEYVDGVNLRHALKASSVAPQEALAIVGQICDALQYAHDAGVVHRDIKPENVLLDRRGQVKIADFGLAKLLGNDADASLTHTHQVMGTLRYMAPEQMEGTHHVDHRADIYSLGVLFYELLTGELPIGRFAPPSKKVHIDVRLDEVVLRALEKEPELRYQQVSEVKTSMEAIYGQMPLHLQRALGHEYKSKTTIFGLPLVHTATGIDPATGKKRVAKGIIAIGDVAVGVVAFGGLAMGGLALGGVTFGVISWVDWRWAW
jgi:serine/threonine protein kinase